MAQDYDLDDILKEFASEEKKNIAPGSDRKPSRTTEKPGTAAPTRAKAAAPTRPKTNTSVQTAGKAANKAEPKGKKPQVKENSGKKKRKNIKGGLIAALVIVLVIFAAATAGGAYVTYNGKIFPNVYVDTISLGGMTSAEAESTLDAAGWTARTCAALKLVTYRDVSVEVDPVSAGIVAGTDSAVSTALAVGRDGNIYGNLLSFAKSLFSAVDVNSLSATENSEYINEKIASLSRMLDESMGDGYTVDADAGELVIAKGQGSLELDSAAIADKVVTALEECREELEVYDLSRSPEMPDFSAILAAVECEPQDAYFVSGSLEAVDGTPGISFSVDTANELWLAAGTAEDVVIPLDVTQPQLTAADMEELLFHDMLGAVTTKYNNSGENRCSNVRLAISKINEYVVYPGEEFSFNTVVGERTEEAGFLPAPAYAGYDDIKDEIGGGVCQVSTCVYAAALFAFLDITDHTSHIYPPNYIQMGTDTTVTIPAEGRSIDFKFVNNKSYPIKIVGYTEEIEDRGDGKPLRTVTVEIWGTLEDDDYMPVEFDNRLEGAYDYDRTIDPAYSDREGYTIKLTHDEWGFTDDYGDGIRTLTHRKVYDSTGRLVKDEITNSTYSEGYAMDTYYYKK